MDETVGVCVATFGDRDKWEEIARPALVSISGQSRQPDQIVYVHGETLADARNTAIERLDTTWCIVCDADDFLDERYVEQMLEGEGTLRFPRVRKVYGDGREELIEYEKGNLLDRNFIVIGAMFRREDFLKVGGFNQSIPIFEDWELWLRMWKLAGVDIQPSRAVYVQNYNPQGRNQDQSVDIGYWYNTIRNRFLI